MNASINQDIYRYYAPIYDQLFGKPMQKSRRRVVELLALQPGERLLVPGIGTGLDLPYIPEGVRITGADTIPEMLSKARRKGRDGVNLVLMDAQHLIYRNATFDAVLLNMILSVAPNGKKVCEEAWRVLRPGGRLVIFDKFLSEGSRISRFRRILGWGISKLGLDPNRSLSEILSGITQVEFVVNEPGWLHGQFRIILLIKQVVLSKTDLKLKKRGGCIELDPNRQVKNNQY